MKKAAIALILCFIYLLGGCNLNAASPENAGCVHTDADDNGSCDLCSVSVIVTVDIFNINDLHGKIADADTHPGVDELTTYIKNAEETRQNVLLLSTGDMWQGSTESNMTEGLLTTDWMNDIGFAAMTLGNHEFDWGEEPVKKNAEAAEFPFLAINIYNRATKAPVDYCQASVVVEYDGIQVGIIGAIGDCYSSIASEKVEDIYFVTDDDLTKLVQKEAEKLRSEGVDFIIYSIHDGFEDSKGAGITKVTSSNLAYYYDTMLSDGYVDLVFEGHTHQRYLLQDVHGVYHMQNGGDNKGISYAKVQVNSVTGTSSVSNPKLITTGEYALLEDDPIVNNLLQQYDHLISPALRVVGQNRKFRSGNEMRQLVADLYYKFGKELWGDEYDITLGGGFVSIRAPRELPAGDVTYAQLQALFPFDNELVLGSIQGRDLLNQFIETENSNYFICRKDSASINPDKTYYIIVDTYSSNYGPNKITEIARYDEKFYARDLLADYIEAGNLD